MKTYFISGHTDLSLQLFNQYYEPEIYRAIQDASITWDDQNDPSGYMIHFLIGGASGVDSMAQDYLSKYINDSRIKVTVYDRLCENNCRIDNFCHVNGFESYTKRDEQMTTDSYEDIAFFRIYMGLGSGTCLNVMRRLIGQIHAMKFRCTARDYLSDIKDYGVLMDRLEDICSSYLYGAKMLDVIKAKLIK